MIAANPLAQGTGNPDLEHATVKAITDAGLIVHGSRGVTTARTAVSCLVDPAAGDLVLLSRTVGDCFVLAVLERTDDSRRISVPGRLAISADELSLQGHQRTAIESEHTTVCARELNVSGERAQARFRETRLIADAIEVVGDRIAQSARRVIRRVEEVETLNVGNLVQRIRANLVSRSKRASITASGDIHVDGKRIHMG